MNQQYEMKLSLRHSVRVNAHQRKAFEIRKDLSNRLASSFLTIEILYGSAQWDGPLDPFIARLVV